MSQQNIDFGTFPDDPSADAIRTAFQKVQNNFNEVYAGLTNASVNSINRSPGAGITVNSPTGNVVVTANISSVTVSSPNLIFGTSLSVLASSTVYTSATQTLYVVVPNTFSIGNMVLSGNANISGNLSVSGNVNLGNAISANYFIGSGNNLSNIQGANISGTVALSTTAGTVTTAAQPNITSTGTLTSLSVSGNANIGNIGTAGLITATGNITGGNITTSGKLVSSIATGTEPLTITSTTRVSNLNVAYANVADYINLTTQTSGNAYLIFGNALTGNVTETGNAAFVANTSNGALYATTFVGDLSGSATTAGTITTAAQPNITSTGTLTSLSVSGNANIGNIGTAGLVVATGNVTGANIISTGYQIHSVDTSISAAGTVQADATVLTKEFNEVSTVSTGSGVVLPSAIAGMAITITNTNANALLVYPAAGAQINSLGTDTSFSQGTTTIQFIAPTTTQWYTVGAA